MSSFSNKTQFFDWRVVTFAVIAFSVAIILMIAVDRVKLNARNRIDRNSLPKVLVSSLISKNPDWRYDKIQLDAVDLFPSDLRRAEFLSIVRIAGFKCIRESIRRLDQCDFEVDPVPSGKKERGSFFRILGLEPTFDSDDQLVSVNVLFGGLSVD